MAAVIPKNNKWTSPVMRVPLSNRSGHFKEVTLSANKFGALFDPDETAATTLRGPIERLVDWFYKTFGSCLGQSRSDLGLALEELREAVRPIINKGYPHLNAAPSQKEMAPVSYNTVMKALQTMSDLIETKEGKEKFLANIDLQIFEGSKAQIVFKECGVTIPLKKVTLGGLGLIKQRSLANPSQMGEMPISYNFKNFQPIRRPSPSFQALHRAFAPPAVDLGAVDAPSQEPAASTVNLEAVGPVSKAPISAPKPKDAAQPESSRWHNSFFEEQDKAEPFQNTGAVFEALQNRLQLHNEPLDNRKIGVLLIELFNDMGPDLDQQKALLEILQKTTFTAVDGGILAEIGKNINNNMAMDILLTGPNAKQVFKQFINNTAQFLQIREQYKEFSTPDTFPYNKICEMPKDNCGPWEKGYLTQNVVLQRNQEKTYPPEFTALEDDLEKVQFCQLFSIYALLSVQFSTPSNVSDEHLVAISQSAKQDAYTYACHLFLLLLPSWHKQTYTKLEVLRDLEQQDLRHVDDQSIRRILSITDPQEEDGKTTYQKNFKPPQRVFDAVHRFIFRDGPQPDPYKSFFGE